MWSQLTDRGKQGVKRSLLTEAYFGIPLSVVVVGANVNDHKLLGPDALSGDCASPHSEPGTTASGLRFDKAAMTIWQTHLIDRDGGNRLELHLRTRGDRRQQPKGTHWAGGHGAGQWWSARAAAQPLPPPAGAVKRRQPITRHKLNLACSLHYFPASRIIWIAS